jgi:hypothetical protein
MYCEFRDEVMTRQNTQQCYWLPSDFIWTFCMCLPIRWFLVRILSPCEHYVQRNSVLCFIKGRNLLQAPVTYWDTAYTDLGYGTSFLLYQLKILLCESVTLTRMCVFSFTTKCSLSHCLSALHVSINTCIHWYIDRQRGRVYCLFHDSGTLKLLTHGTGYSVNRW